MILNGKKPSGKRRASQKKVRNTKQGLEPKKINQLERELSILHNNSGNLMDKIQYSENDDERLYCIEKCNNLKKNFDKVLLSLFDLRSSNPDNEKKIADIKENASKVMACNICNFHNLEQHKTAIDLYRSFKNSDLYRHLDNENRENLLQLDTGSSDSHQDVDLKLRSKAQLGFEQLQSELKLDQFHEAYQIHQKLAENNLYLQLSSGERHFYVVIRAVILAKIGKCLSALNSFKKNHAIGGGQRWEQADPNIPFDIVENLWPLFKHPGYDILKPDMSKPTIEHDDPDDPDDPVMQDIIKNPFEAAELCMHQALTIFESNDIEDPFQRWKYYLCYSIKKLNLACTQYQKNPESKLKRKEFDDIFSELTRKLEKIAKENKKNYRPFKADFHFQLFRLHYIYYQFLLENQLRLGGNFDEQLTGFKITMIEHLTHAVNYDSKLAMYYLETEEVKSWFKLASKQGNAFGIYHQTLQTIEQLDENLGCNNSVLKNLSMAKSTGNPYALIAYNDYRHRKKEKKDSKLLEDLLGDYSNALENNDNSALLNTMGERLFYRYKKPELAKQYWQRARDAGDYKGAYHLAQACIFEIIPFKYTEGIDRYNLTLSQDNDWFNKDELGRYQTLVLRGLGLCVEALKLGMRNDFLLCKTLICLFNIAACCIESEMSEKLYKQVRNILELTCTGNIYNNKNVYTKADFLSGLERCYQDYKQHPNGAAFTKGTIFIQSFWEDALFRSKLSNPVDVQPLHPATQEDLEVLGDMPYLPELFPMDTFDVIVERLMTAATTVFHDRLWHQQIFNKYQQQINKDILALTEKLQGEKTFRLNTLVRVLQGLGKLQIDSNSPELRLCLSQIFLKTNSLDCQSVDKKAWVECLVSLSAFTPAEIGIEVLSRVLDNIVKSKGGLGFWAIKEGYHAIAVLAANASPTEFNALVGQFNKMIEMLNEQVTGKDFQQIDERYIHRFLLATDYLKASGCQSIQALTETDDYQQQVERVKNRETTENISATQRRVTDMLQQEYGEKKVAIEYKFGLLPADCYLEAFNIAIEVNGHQHYRCNGNNSNVRELTTQDKFKVKYKALKIQSGAQNRGNRGNRGNIICLDVTLCDNLSDAKLIQYIKNEILAVLTQKKKPLPSTSALSAGSTSRSSFFRLGNGQSQLTIATLPSALAPNISKPKVSSIKR